MECISVDELKARRSRGEKIVVVDVRSSEEYSLGHVDGALHVPLDDIDLSTNIPSDWAVVTACGKGGGRSNDAAEIIRGLGWNDVKPLCGGTDAWLVAVASSK